MVEEVVVTGSYIRRGDSFDTATPVDVLDMSAISEQGVTNLGEAVRNQSFSYGVDTVSNVLGQVLGGTNFQDGVSSNANLYGLGENATLTLMNGRRTESRNLQTMYPNIMVERIETLTDGAATAYGTDAVAGVVNIIPRTDFQGVKFEASYNNDGTKHDWDEYVYSGMVGAGNDQTRIVASVEYRDRGRLSYRERKDLLYAQLSTSSTGNPGVWLVPTRNPDGSLTGTSQQQLDPGCGQNRSVAPNQYEDEAAPLGNATGIVGDLTGRCLYDFGGTINYMDPIKVVTGAVVAEHDFNENMHFSGEAMFALLDVRGGGGDSPTDPGGRLGELPVVSGDHPGNPYRAMVDSNGDGVLDTPLYAQDLNGDGIPDRDASNQVILAANPFDPASGVPFAEDVTPVSWRQTGKLACLPFTPNDPRIRSDCSGELAFFSTDQYRVAGRFEYDIPDSNWYVYFDALWHRVNSSTFEHQATSLTNLQLGLTGQLQILGSDAHWFNPFSTQAYACVNRDCSGGVQQTDFNQLNQTEVWQRIQQDSAIGEVRELNVEELVAAGDLFNLPAGPVGMAIGVQRRYRKVSYDAAQLSNARDEFVNVQAGDYTEDRKTLDAFVEFEVPLFDTERFGNADLNLAGRYTNSWDNSDADLKDEIFKVAGRWEPRPWVALRSSYGQSFIAPTIEALFTPPTYQVGNVSDTFLGGATAFVAQGAGGTPTLDPETSTSLNIGATMRFLDDKLTVRADWKQFKFKHRIARAAVQDVIQDQVDLFNSVCQPVNGVCTGSAPYAGLPVEDGLAPADPGIDARELFLRNNPNQPGADPNVVGESSLVRRNSNTLAIESVITPLQNLAKMEWQGVDFGVTYAFEGADLPFVERDIGLFNVGVTGTWVNKFEVQEGAGAPTVDGVGKRNQPSGFLPPVPEWRTVGRINWMMSRHSFTILGRYNSSLKEDDSICNLPRALLLELGAESGGCPSHVPAKVIWDMNYRLDLDGLIGDRSASFEIGAINVFDTYPPLTAALGAIETFLYDPRGRQLYAKFRVEL